MRWSSLVAAATGLVLSSCTPKQEPSSGARDHHPTGGSFRVGNGGAGGATVFAGGGAGGTFVSGAGGAGEGPPAGGGGGIGDTGELPDHRLDVP